MKAMLCPQHFLHYNKSMGNIFGTHRKVTLNWVFISGPKPNLSEIFCLYWLPASFTNIRSKMKLLSYPQHLFQRSRARNSEVYIRMWQEFELVRGFIAALVICKFDDDPSKNEGTVVPTLHYKSHDGENFYHSMASNSTASSPIWPQIELVHDFMSVLLTCKFDDDPIKNEGAFVSRTFSPL